MMRNGAVNQVFQVIYTSRAVKLQLFDVGFRFPG